jgi:hypothetical protein
MGNCCTQGNIMGDFQSQFLFHNETTNGVSEDKDSKLYNSNPNKYNTNKYSNFIRVIKEQAEIISEEDFETIIQSNFPDLHRIIYPEENAPSSLPPKNIFSFDPIKFPSGEIYKGGWNSNKKRQGFGISISADGNTLYKGNWENDKIGDFGLFLEKNGNYYLGQIKEGKFEGKGELNIKGISKYNGEFKNDLPEGKGIFEDYENNYKYDGDWSMGKKNGRGVLVFSDGTKYEGDFKNDLYDGNGIIKFNNGNVYEGEFVEGNIKGKGKFVWNDGKKYDGDYEDFMKNGFGKFFWKEKKYYEGQWLNNKQHGQGKICHEGNEIEGTFRFGKIIKGK